MAIDFVCHPFFIGNLALLRQPEKRGGKKEEIRNSPAH